MASTVAFSWQTVRNFIWLLCGVACLLFALILWASQLKTQEVEVVQIEKQAQEAARPVKSEAIGTDTRLATFNTEVRPIVLKQRAVSVGEHEAEFRGSKFLTENQKSWTLQVMQVREEDIIRSYLDKREDRKNFQYFRLQAEDKPEQFVLTYGVYKDVKDVLDKTTSIDLQLPEGIKTIPEKFTTYSALVNDLGTDELSSGLKLRPVNLTKAALPVVPLRPASSTTTTAQPSIASSTTEANQFRGGTTTTIKRTDQNNQQQKVQTDTSYVPSLQEQRTTPLPTPRPATPTNEPQVVDPF